MSALPVLARAEGLVVCQQREMVEIFTDFETANRYAIHLPGGQMLYAAEESNGAMAFLTRSFLKARRPFTMHVVDPSGRRLFTLRRPWTWFFSEIRAVDGEGRDLGKVEQRFAFFSKRFTVTDATGIEIGELRGPIFRPWTFKIMRGGEQVGAIRKKWSGFLKEAFTDADNFGVEFGTDMDARLRELALAAVFLVDFLYFEDRG